MRALPRGSYGARLIVASRRMRVIGFAVAFVVVVVLDQLSKMLMRGFLADGRSVTLIPGVMDLHLVFNRGAAFGMGEGGAWVFVAVAVLIALGCVVYVLVGKPSVPLATVLGVVAGGGVGNLIDRVGTGAVTDFFLPTCIDFAVFNVADIAITCGFVVALILFWRAESKREVQDEGLASNSNNVIESLDKPSTSKRDF